MPGAIQRRHGVGTVEVNVFVAQQRGRSLMSLALDEALYRLVSALQRRSLRKGMFGTPMIVSSSDLIGHRIISTGHFESREIEGFDFILADPRGAIGEDIDWTGSFVDVGANIGIYSIRYGARFERTFTVEANPLTFDILKANLSLADVGTVTPICSGASDRQGTASLQVPTAGLLGWARLGEDIDWQARSVTIPVAPLDDLLDAQGPRSRVSLMKIDVEGHERQVLLGARRILERDAPVVFYEALSGTEGQACSRILLDAGYDGFFTLKPPPERPRALARATRPLRGRRSRAHRCRAADLRDQARRREGGRLRRPRRDGPYLTCRVGGRHARCGKSISDAARKPNYPNKIRCGGSPDPSAWAPHQSIMT